MREGAAAGGDLRVMPIRSLLLCALAGVALVWLVLETRSLAEQVGRGEVEVREARGTAAAATDQLAAARAANADLQAAVARLEAELLQWQQQHAAMAAAVGERAAADERAAAAAAAARAALMAPMPEGVRQCLAALHECLQAEGFAAVRFVSARALDEDGLHEVEMVEVDPDGLGATVVHAERMTAALDRPSGRLELRFFAGHRTAGGERAPLPEDGHVITFAGIDGRSFEARLPFLVRGTGAYPETAAAALDATRVDPVTRASWLERLDRLFAAASGTTRLSVQRFRGMKDGWFLDVQFVGTDDRNHVTLFADCSRCAVEVDAAAGVVSLLLQDGLLRSRGVESNISAEGYRMLLPDVTPQRATEIMLGMVVAR